MHNTKIDPSKTRKGEATGVVDEIEARIDKRLRDLGLVDSFYATPLSSAHGLASGSDEIDEGPGSDFETSFLELSDTPNTYLAAAGFVPIVNAGETALVFIDPSLLVGAIAHGSLTGLTDDDHAQYALLAGRSGGQHLKGSILASQNLTLESTAHATKGFIKAMYSLVVNGASNSIIFNAASFLARSLVHCDTAAETALLAALKHSATAGSGATLYLGRSRGTEGAESIVSNNDVLAVLRFLGFDSVDYAQAAKISVEVDGVPGSGDMPTRMIFATTKDAETNPTEAVRINSKQFVGIGAIDPLVLLDLFASGSAPAPSLGTLLRLINSAGTGDCNIEIIADNEGDSTIFFGDETENEAAYILYQHLAKAFLIQPEDTGEVTINPGNLDVDFNVRTNALTDTLHVNGATNRVGVRESNPLAAFHVGGVDELSIPEPKLDNGDVVALLETPEAGRYYDLDKAVPVFRDTQRFRHTSDVGCNPYALPKNFVANATFTSSLALPQIIASNSGCVTIPYDIAGHFDFSSVTIRSNDTSGGRSWKFALYCEYSRSNTLTRVAVSNGSDAFTPAGVAQNRTLAVLNEPIYLGPGIYWLVIQCDHATNPFNLGTALPTSSFLRNYIRTKTTTAIGATLDMSTGWTAGVNIIAASLNGQALGEGTAF